MSDIQQDILRIDLEDAQKSLQIVTKELHDAKLAKKDAELAVESANANERRINEKLKVACKKANELELIVEKQSQELSNLLKWKNDRKCCGNCNHRTGPVVCGGFPDWCGICDTEGARSCIDSGCLLWQNCEESR